MMKICLYCKAGKSITDFGVDKRAKDGTKSSCKDCISVKNKQRRTKEKNKISNQNIDGKYRAYKASAKKRDLIFDLTKDDFETFWQKLCHYCDNPIKTIGIDRKDNSVGYVLNNCLSCCEACNKGKGTSTYEEYIERCKRIAKKWS